ncbi:MAG: hypothetical protein NUV91_01880, partial [Candidatus Omnitrophica bacterium]|nr:hypothetical protein [Candidatus Omnitrophota bacterium]
MSATRSSRRKSFLIHSVYIFIDVVFICLSIYWACSLRSVTLPFPITFSNIFLNYTHPFHIIFLFWIFILILINHLHGLYQTRREIIETIEIWELLKSIVYAYMLTIVMVYALNIKGFPRGIFVFSGVFMLISLSFWRILKRKFVEFLVSQGYNNFNVLIVGAGKVGQALADECSKRKALGLHVVGFLDDYKASQDLPEDSPVLGKI